MLSEGIKTGFQTTIKFNSLKYHFLILQKEDIRKYKNGFGERRILSRLAY